jgi:uncharacterized protein HemX
MTYIINGRGVLLGIMLLFAALIVGGCTKYASQEDLQALERQKQATLSAEQRATQLESEIKDLERQITEKQSTLRQKQALLDQLKGR